MEVVRSLPDPEAIRAQFPLTEKQLAAKIERDQQIQEVFSGKSDRLILIIGPCSADREDAVLEYIHRLYRVQQQVADKILIVPRIYTNKPRTTGDGYKACSISLTRSVNRICLPVWWPSAACIPQPG